MFDFEALDACEECFVEPYCQHVELETEATSCVEPCGQHVEPENHSLEPGHQHVKLETDATSCLEPDGQHVEPREHSVEPDSQHVELETLAKSCVEPDGKHVEPEGRSLHSDARERYLEAEAGIDTSPACLGAGESLSAGWAARPTVGDYYETACRVMMREMEDLKSTFLGYIPAQTSMVVLEVPESKNSRRIRVCEEHGVRGWVSIAKESGEQLLRQVSGTLALKARFDKLLRYSSAVNSPAAGVRQTSSTLICDKCDGPHATDCCPFFKKAREDHKDAWANYGERKPHAMGSDGGNFVLHRARVVAQPGDGSCLFHSLCYSLSERFYDSAEQLRREIARFIESHTKLEIAGNTIEEWVLWDQQSSAQTYAWQMARTGWGGGLELACFSRMKNMNVHVYERSGGSFKRISCFDVPRPVQTVHILYQGGVHYDALVPLM